MWEYILGGVIALLISICAGAKWSMKYAWEQQKKELEELKEELEQMEELTDELRFKKEEIEELLNNEFRDFNALFKRKNNID